MMQKRNYTSLMMIILGAMLLNSCSSDKADTPSVATSDDAGTQTEQQTESMPSDALPDDLDFGGREFRVASFPINHRWFC